VANAGGRYFGFVTGGALPAAVAARWLLDVWDQNPALYLLSPVAARLENVCERWLVELLDLPAGTAAGYVVGTSAATICGLVAGRNHLLARQGWDAHANGLFGAPPLRVVVGEQAHATVFRALGLLGLGQARIERVPVDGEGRMIASRVPVLDERSLVIVQAGNVNSGSFDPIGAICDRARQVGAWVHVDGAFGLWAAASRRHRALVAGVEGADSWSVDAHKTLNAPYDNGIVLCRKREALVSALHMTASYILYGNERNGTQYTTDLSRRPRAIELWATIKSLGRSGVEDLVDRLCDHAQRFAALLSASGFRVLNEVVFNQVLVACETPAMTLATVARLQESGECWCGEATWNDEPVIRISVCSWATTTADVDRSVAAFIAARKRAERDVVQRV